MDSKLNKREIEILESFGFQIGEFNIFEKQGDWETYYLIYKNNEFHLEVQQTLIEEDGTFYTDYYKEYPNDESLEEFLTNFFG